jgi:hypothetical protein
MAITRTTLGAAIDADERRIPLASTTGMLVGDLIAVGQEIMQVNGVPVAGTAKVQRGMAGTAAKAHATGASAEFGQRGDFNAFGTRSTDGPDRGFGLARRANKVYTAAGEINVEGGTHVIDNGGAGALAMTLADPGADDEGMRLTIVTGSDDAHTVSNAAGSGFNGGGAGEDVCTFAAATGSSLELVAVGGVWLVVGNEGGTLA